MASEARLVECYFVRYLQFIKGSQVIVSNQHFNSHACDCLQPAHLIIRWPCDCRFMRELPYGFDVLLENLVDPSHVPFTHSGVIGNRNEAAVSRMTPNRKLSTNGGFTMDLKELKAGSSDLVEKGGKNTDSTLYFVPPTLTRYCAPHLSLSSGHCTAILIRCCSFNLLAHHSRPGCSRCHVASVALLNAAVFECN